MNGDEAGLEKKVQELELVIQDMSVTRAGTPRPPGESLRAASRGQRTAIVLSLLALASSVVTFLDHHWPLFH